MPLIADTFNNEEELEQNNNSMPQDTEDTGDRIVNPELNDEPDDEEEQIKPIAVVISSRKSQAENMDFVNHLQQMALFPVHPYFYQNNNLSLPSVYNQILAQVTEDIVVFIHDDVEIISAGWARTLWNLFKENPEYGIIGVAGSKDYDEYGAWWIYQNKVGRVFHRQDVEDKEGNKGYVTFRTDFSEKLPEGHIEEVCIIDGLFMAMDKRRNVLTFDEDISGFNFYDVSMCLRNFKEKTTKIGVTTDINLAHRGLGVIKPEWFVNRAKTMEKFADILPINNLQLNTPTEGRMNVEAFSPENDPWKNGQIRVVTREEAEAIEKQQAEAKNNQTEQPAQ